MRPGARVAVAAMLAMLSTAPRSASRWRFISV